MATSAFSRRQENDINIGELETAIKRYQDSISSNETRSCLMDVESVRHLLDYITYFNENKPADTPGIAAIRIYLFKPENNQILSLQKSNRDPHGFVKFNKRIAQTGFAIVPASNYKVKGVHEVSANDAPDFVDKSVIYGIIPGLTHEGSGLCPTNCGGSYGGVG